MLEEEGIWNVGHETSTAGVTVSLDGEGWSLALKCRAVQQQRLALQPRHYERIIAQQKESLDAVWTGVHELQLRFTRVEVFLQDQVTRATRILAESGSSRGEARLRAEGRLRLAQEIRNVARSSAATP